MNTSLAPFLTVAVCSAVFLTGCAMYAWRVLEPMATSPSRWLGCTLSVILVTGIVNMVVS